MLEKSLKTASSTNTGAPVAIVDVGSNSVRLVVYECLGARQSIFNEKSLCALGKGIATTGKLPKGGVEKALALCAVSGS